MAQHEADRDDLFAELQSCPQRYELQLPDGSIITIGVRRDERLSLYFSQDEVYHLLPPAALTRAYVAPWLYRTQGETLARLRRERTPDVTTLIRSDLTEREWADFRQRLLDLINLLVSSARSGDWRALRLHASEPSTALADLQARLERIVEQGVTLAPPFPGRG